MSRTIHRTPRTLAYVTILRADPCSYCATAPAPQSTLDHISPLHPSAGPRGRRDWRNLTAACVMCNQAKRNVSLLMFLLTRSAQIPRELPKWTESSRELSKLEFFDDSHRHRVSHDTLSLVFRCDVVSECASPLERTLL